MHTHTCIERDREKLFIGIIKKDWWRNAAILASYIFVNFSNVTTNNN